MNYSRATIAQEGSGHISPIAAYHLGTNRFLILDVTAYKYPPVWIDVDDLWEAISTIDFTSKKLMVI